MKVCLFLRYDHNVLPLRRSCPHVNSVLGLSRFESKPETLLNDICIYLKSMTNVVILDIEIVNYLSVIHSNLNYSDIIARIAEVVRVVLLSSRYIFEEFLYINRNLLLCSMSSPPISFFNEVLKSSGLLSPQNLESLNKKIVSFTDIPELGPASPSKFYDTEDFPVVEVPKEETKKGIMSIIDEIDLPGFTPFRLTKDVKK